MKSKSAIFTSFIILIFAAQLCAQEGPLYSKTIANPYSDTELTLTVQTESGTLVRELVNYLFYAEDSSEVNVIVVRSEDPLQISLHVSGLSETLSVADVYANLSGLDAADFNQIMLETDIAVTYDGQTRSLSAASYAQDIEWTWDYPTSRPVSTGLLRISCNVQDMLSYDEANGARLHSDFGVPLAKKAIYIQRIGPGVKEITISPILERAGNLESEITLPFLEEQSPWRSLNIWEDGALLSQDAIEIEFQKNDDGLATYLVAWPLTQDSSYQLQLVSHAAGTASATYSGLLQD